MCDLRLLPPTRVRDLTCHSPAAIRHARAKQVLGSPFRGVLVGGEVERDPSVMVRAAQLSVGEQFPGSHHSGAHLLGFGVVDDRCVHLCGAESEVDRGQKGLRLHSTHRPPATYRVGGVLVTAPDRTAVDLARELHPREQLVVLDAALRTGLVTPDTLRAEAEAQHGLRGIVAVRRTIEIADPRAESPQESRLRWIAIAAALPDLDLQIDIRTPTGRYRLDLGYARYRVGIEYDGVIHADRLIYDRARHNALDALRWRLLYFTKDDISHPNRTAARIGAAIGVRPRFAVPRVPF
ncbi:DUF559 domain-containing protein [Jatrophihabitans sp. YIM 134969]